MRIVRIVEGDVIPLEELFEEVARSWDLSPSERAAVRGDALYAFGRRQGARSGRRSRFCIERMALIVDIDWLLGRRMDREMVRLWIRRRVAHVFGSSPLELMVGSTDRLREIRALLSVELSQ